MFSIDYKKYILYLFLSTHVSLSKNGPFGCTGHVNPSGAKIHAGA
jgi:hypothetical protein